MASFSTSTAMVPVPKRKIVIARDIEMLDQSPETLTLPEFVATTYKKTVEQLRAFASQMANTEELVRLSKEDRHQLQSYNRQLERNMCSMYNEFVSYASEEHTYNKKQYGLLTTQCRTFEVAVNTQFSMLSNNQAEI